MNTTKLQFFRSPLALVLTLALAAGIGWAWYVNSLGLTKILVDQNAHLNITRQLLDSLTPGISQLGFWPPLLHVIMMPFTAISPLYFSGLAGAFALVPALLLAVYFLYKLFFAFTQHRLVSAAGASLFVLNPFVLYYSVTPMMEVLFLANLFGVAYFTLRWLQTHKLSFLMGTGVFVMLASISRFEGLVLIPLVGAVIGADLLMRRRRWAEVEASLIMFLFIALLGALFIVAYGWIFGGDPLAFMNSQWSAFSQQQDYALPAQGSIVGAFQYLLHASYYMLGKTQILIGVAALALVFLLRPSFSLLATSVILISPFLFDWLSLFRGNILIYVPEFFPYGNFFNERYGLYWIGFILLGPVLLAGIIAKSARLKQAVPAFAGVMLLGLLGINGWHTAKAAYTDNYRIVRETTFNYPSAEQLDLVDSLKKEYDYGKIFITRATQDFVTTNAGISLDQYIVESNYRFYDQTMNRPWLFARWVVMFNNQGDQSALIPAWSQSNEKISARWGDSQIFHDHYELVMENRFERLYRLREDVVRDYAQKHGFDLAQVPSLQRDLDTWDPLTIYALMDAAELEYVADADEPLSRQVSVQTEPEPDTTTSTASPPSRVASSRTAANPTPSRNATSSRPTTSPTPSSTSTATTSRRVAPQPQPATTTSTSTPSGSFGQRDGDDDNSGPGNRNDDDRRSSRRTLRDLLGL